MGNLYSPVKWKWHTYQAILDQNPPVLNTLHQVFTATGGVRLIALTLLQTNTPTNPEDIDILITRDGAPYLYDASAVGGLVNNNQYYCTMTILDPRAIPIYQVNLMDAVALGYAQFFLVPYAGQGSGSHLEGTEITVEIRQTSAIAAGARVTAKATYAVQEVI